MRRTAGAFLVTMILSTLFVIPFAAAATRPVTIKDLQFGKPPYKVFANPGDMVRWIHRDGESTPHTVTSDSGLFSSSESNTCPGRLLDDCMYEPDTYSFTFNAVGTYPYHCKVHAGMTGTVHVVPKGPPTSSTSSSPGSSSPAPRKTSPSPTATATGTGTATSTGSPTGSASPTISSSPRAGGGGSGSSSAGKIAVAAVGVALLAAAGLLVYRRFLTSS